MKKTVLSLGMAMAFLCAVPSAIANENSKNVEGVTLHSVAAASFCKAIIKGDINRVQEMIDAGENLDKKYLGKTPLHYAARYNRPEILKLLIKKGANLKKRCDQGFTVKKYAEMANAAEVIAILNNAS